MVDVQVWWAGLTHAHVSLVDLLDATEAGRLAELDLPADRARFLVGVALLRTAVASSLDAAPEQVEIDRTCAECGGPHGPPRVAGGPHVSVSHSGVLVVVATCVGAAVGVDVQRARELGGQDSVTWTRNEARFKAIGDTEASPSATIDLDPPLSGYSAALTVAAPDPPRVLTFDAGAVLAAVSSREG